MARLFTALDFSDKEKVMHVCRQCDGVIDGFKIGLELFCSQGPDIVRKVSEFGEVFLDLKFHDIPNTMTKAALAVSSLPVSIINIHAVSGGIAMRSVVDAVKDKAPDIKVIAVTMLTSIDSDMCSELGYSRNVADQVMLLADMAAEAGCDGVVCSPEEVALIKKRFPHFLTVVPGIRPAHAETGDQKRVATPSQAVSNGADILICGRPIYNSDNIRRSVKDIKKDMEA